jgi:hypothetical protein
MPKRSPISDLEFHLRRARSEREVAYRLGDGPAADAHLRLSALHLQRALLLQEVRTEPVGNVRPFKRPPVRAESSAALPILELPSIR